MKVEVPYGETTVTADLPGNTRLLSNVERASLQFLIRRHPGCVAASLEIEPPGLGGARSG